MVGVGLGVDETLGVVEGVGVIDALGVTEAETLGVGLVLLLDDGDGVTLEDGDSEGVGDGLLDDELVGVPDCERLR